MALYQKMTAEYRLTQRWYPKGAMQINDPEGLGVCYVSPWLQPETWQVVAYAGTAGKPSFNNRFRSREQAEKSVETFFTSLLAHKVRLAEYRGSEKPHALKAGDIITNSWGYDQTNVDWYRITRTSEFYVWLKPIAGHTTETRFMSGQSVPHVETMDADPTKWGYKDLNQPEQRHKATSSGNGESYVCFKYGSGSKWDGKERYESWYA